MGLTNNVMLAPFCHHTVGHPLAGDSFSTPRKEDAAEEGLKKMLFQRQNKEVVMKYYRWNVREKWPRFINGEVI